jgi:hypothetical protein
MRNGRVARAFSALECIGCSGFIRVGIRPMGLSPVIALVSARLRRSRSLWWSERSSGDDHCNRQWSDTLRSSTLVRSAEMIRLPCWLARAATSRDLMRARGAFMTAFLRRQRGKRGEFRVSLFDISSRPCLALQHSVDTGEPLRRGAVIKAANAVVGIPKDSAEASYV